MSPLLVPVKNTFVHFGDASETALLAQSQEEPWCPGPVPRPGGGPYRQLRRWSTDPEETCTGSDVKADRYHLRCISRTTMGTTPLEEMSTTTDATSSEAEILITPDRSPRAGPERPTPEKEPFPEIRFGSLPPRQQAKQEAESDQQEEEHDDLHEEDEGEEEEAMPATPEPSPRMWRGPYGATADTPSPRLPSPPTPPSASSQAPSAGPEPKPFDGGVPGPQQGAPPEAQAKAEEQLPSAATAAPPAMGHFPADAIAFNITLRRADGVPLGLDVDQSRSNRLLLVRRVAPGGAIDAWNRQCREGPTAGKQVMPGDVIVMVNGRPGCQGMLEECRSRMLLKITVARWDPDLAFSFAGSVADCNPQAGGC